MRGYFLVFLVFCFGVLNGQAPACGTNLELNDPEQRAAFEQFLSNVEGYEKGNAIDNRAIRYYQVVIHVVAPFWYQHVSVAQALQQIDVLNRDFAGTGENVERLPADFRDIVGSAQLQFCLATTDPDGAPTSGITFTETDIRDIALRYGEGGRRVIHYDQLGGKTGWDPTRYINIWLGEFGTILGSSAFPGLTPHDEEIGLVINISHFGAIGDAGYVNEYGRGHTLTHEMGHFFGLTHIWGQGTNPSCNDSDNITDTPNAAGPYFNCPDGDRFSCGTNNMYQNFMDLTDDYCLAAFTQGQVNRMRAVADIYYPDMHSENACTVPEPNYDTWYDGLVWASDPGSDKLVLYHPEGFTGAVKVEVFSADGKRVQQGSWVNDVSALIDLSRVGPGVYFVYLTYLDSRKCRKIVVY